MLHMPRLRIRTAYTTTAEGNHTLQTLLPTLLLWLEQFGYPALWLVVFIAAIGLPLPIGLIVMGAGAFVAFGRFDFISLTFIVVSASVCGDSVGYWLGRLGGVRLSRWLQNHPRNHFVSQRNFERSHRYFQHHGGWAIFLSRFLFSGFGGPVNLLSGLEFYSFSRFLLFDTAGETIGALLSLTLGFLFGSKWQYVAQLLNTFTLFITGILIAIITLYLVLKLLRHYNLLPDFLVFLVDRRQRSPRFYR